MVEHPPQLYRDVLASFALFLPTIGILDHNITDLLLNEDHSRKEIDQT